MRTLIAMVILAMCGNALAHGGKAHAGNRIDYSKAEETAFGKAADPKKATRSVRVQITDDKRFLPGEITVNRGDVVRFIPVNKGRVAHDMVLGTMEHLKTMTKKGRDADEPHMVHVAPGKSGELGWQFTKAGEFFYACLVPGHMEGGMVGKVKVLDR